MIEKINVDFYEPYPKNPKIAKVFKEIGFADELGSGVKNMVKYTQIYSGGMPTFKEDDIFRTFIPLAPQDTPQDTNRENHTEDSMEMLIMQFCKEPRSIREIMAYIELKDRKHVYMTYIKPLIAKNIIKMTIPKKPTSKNQKYILNNENIK